MKASQSQRQIQTAQPKRPVTAKASARPQIDLKPKMKTPKPVKEVQNALTVAVTQPVT